MNNLLEKDKLTNTVFFTYDVAPVGQVRLYLQNTYLNQPFEMLLPQAGSVINQRFASYILTQSDIQPLDVGLYTYYIKDSNNVELEKGSMKVEDNEDFGHMKVVEFEQESEYIAYQP